MGKSAFAKIAAALATAAPAQIAQKVGATADTNGACQAGWYYRTTARGANSIVGVGARQSNYNFTPYHEVSHFRAQVSGTVNATVSGNLEVSRDLVIESVRATYGINAQVSMAATLGNSMDVRAASERTANAQCGVWRAYAEILKTPLEMFSSGLVKSQRKKKHNESSIVCRMQL